MALEGKTILLFSIIVLLFAATTTTMIIPVTGEQAVPASDTVDNRGLTLQFNDGTQLLIASQPSGSIGYVSSMPGVVTSFQQAEILGSTGLIAHNYLSGGEFFDLQIGDSIAISAKQENDTLEYRVVAVEQYQALQPTSIHSRFLNLESGENISAHQLSQHIYGREGHLILQTCIENDGNLEWGRLFVIAEPVTI